MLSETITNILVPHVPVIEKIVRPLIVYLALIILLRIFGKRELAQLNPFDLVVLLSLSNTVQNAIIGDDNSLSGGLIGAATLLTVNYLVVRFVFRHRRLDQLLEGSPLVLIEHGEVNERALAKELMSVSELTIVAHRLGFKSLDEVESCVLEPGSIPTRDLQPSPWLRIMAAYVKWAARQAGRISKAQMGGARGMRRGVAIHCAGGPWYTQHPRSSKCLKIE